MAYYNVASPTVILILYYNIIINIYTIPTCLPTYLPSYNIRERERERERGRERVLIVV